jgi:hypothetical protein
MEISPFSGFLFGEVRGEERRLGPEGYWKDDVD